jgi:hypothetical protein
MTFYTCDLCEWAGTFEASREHHAETGHDRLSQRKPPAAPLKPVTAPEITPWTPTTVPVRPCNHSFTWLGVIPPTHCTICGAPLARSWVQPYTTREWAGGTSARLRLG